MAGKWISDLTAATPLAAAAQHVLTVRLKIVDEYLPLALREPDKDPEYIHQLRVGTRRARAALDIFALCLPGKIYKAVKKILRNIRRAAGAARDWDVFLAGLSEPSHKPGPRQRAGIDFLIGYALAQRVLAQEYLAQTARSYPFAFDRFSAEAVASVHKPHDGRLATLADLARLQLGDLIQELNRAGESGFDDYARLHQVRIIGKRLRYAMEVFADCFATPFREKLYPAVEEMQEILGAANDSHVASGRLDALRAKLQATLPASWKRYKLGIEGLLRYHQARLPRERHRFLEWWDQWQQSGAKATLTELLMGGAPDASHSSSP
jgi:CHAD domain-containing protein